MKTIYIKIAVVFSFLIIMIPSGKLTIPNGGILSIMVLQTIEYFPQQGLKIDVNFDAILALITLFCNIIIFKKNKYFVLACIAVQYVWLYNAFKPEDLKDVYYISTAGLYVLLSLTLLFIVFVKPKKFIAKNSKQS